MKTIGNNRLAKVVCVTMALVVSTSSAFALPPDPDNAALLYYQAYLLYQQPDDTMADMVADLAQGKIEPNPEIKKHIESCRSAIDLVVTAADMANCDWGLKFSDGFSMEMAHLGQTRRMVFLIIAEARVLASEGAYRQALERCLTVRKMARHIGDETFISILVSIVISRMANNCIPDILADMPKDLETLTWLKNRLLVVTGRALSIKTALKTEREVALESMRLEKVKELLAEILAGEAIAPGSKEAELLRTVDENFMEKSRDYYSSFMDSLQAILDAGGPYTKTYAELKELSEKPQKDGAENTAATLTAALAPALYKIYGQEVRAKTHSNALRTAVDVYIIKAKTGRLPDRLPAGSPKDLFSGKDFEYQKTKDGFVLRCRGRDLVKDEIPQYEFKIKR